MKTLWFIVFDCSWKLPGTIFKDNVFSEAESGGGGFEKTNGLNEDFPFKTNQRVFFFLLVRSIEDRVYSFYRVFFFKADRFIGRWCENIAFGM